MLAVGRRSSCHRPRLSNPNFPATHRETQPLYIHTSSPQQCPDDDAKKGQHSPSSSSSLDCYPRIFQKHTHLRQLTTTAKRTMPFIANTPESLIQRSDSRDPAATCRGLTSTGRPCRRPVAGPPLSSPTRSNNTPSESTYCWQHKDQAPSTTARLPQGLQKSTIRERTSIDTLVDRLGLLEVESPTKGARRRRPRSADPAVHVPEKKENTRISEKPSQKPSKKTEPEKTWEFLCCFGIADEEAIARPTRTPNNGPKTSSLPSRVSMPNAQNGAPSRPRIERDPPSRTAELLSLIPREVSPETSAILLAELAKPVSALDEPGFIYIFVSTALPFTLHLKPSLRKLLRLYI